MADTIKLVDYERLSYYDKKIKSYLAKQSDLDALQKDVDDLLYKQIAITSFSNTVRTAQIGSTVNTITFNWSLNKTPKALTLNTESLDINARTKTIKDANITTNTSWTLIATDERNAKVSANTSLTFLNGVYFGVAQAVTEDEIDSVFIRRFNVQLTSARQREISVAADTDQYIYYAIPTRFGTPSFFVGGFEGGFNKVKTFDFTNSNNYTESYDVWRTTNSGLGKTTITIK